jgi:hypothetical protein
MRSETEHGSFAGGHELIPDEAPEAVYRGQHSMVSIGFVLIGTVLLLLEVYLVQQVLDGQIRGKMAMIPWLVPIAIGFFLFRGISNLLNPITVAVYPHGFAYQRGKHLDFCTWERITTFWSYRYCVPNVVPRIKYWVTRDDGAIFAFKDSRLHNVEELAGTIYAHVRDRLLAPALAAFNAGERVEFGPIAIDRQGLAYRGEHLTWDRIEEAHADTEGDFVVKKRGKTYAWCELSTARIPNFWVFNELLDQGFGGATT